MAVESGRATAGGEVTAAAALAALPADLWRVFHDVRWPGRSRALLDHVVVGPAGVFVVGDRSLTGSIDVADGVLRQNGRRRSRTVARAAAAALAVAEVLDEARSGLDTELVKPVLCLVREDPVFGWAEEVMVCSSANVATMLTSRPKVLDEVQVHAAAVALQRCLLGGAPRRHRHRPGRVRSALVIAAVGTVVTLGLALAVPRWGPLLEAEAQERLLDTHPLGEVVTMAGNPMRPELRVSVDGVRRTRVLRPERLVRTGDRVIGAAVTIRNTGTQGWVSGPATSFVLLDADGVSHPRDVRVQAVTAGPVLGERVRLGPHRSRRGYVVFTVPADLELARVRVTVDPGYPRSHSWTVDEVEQVS